MSDSSVSNTARDPALDDHAHAKPEGGEISLLDMAIVIAKHKKYVLGLPLLAAVLAAGLSLLLPNVYTAESKILPPQQSQSTASAMLGQLGLGGLAGAGGAAMGLKNSNDVYVAMLKSRTVADNLVERFKLKTVYETSTQSDARKTLQGNSRISAGKDGLITVEFDDEDPRRAAEIANAYVDELYKLTQTLAVTEASQRRLFYEKQLELTKNKLAQAEVDLQRTQETTGLIKIDEQAKAIISAVASLRGQIAAKEVQLGAMRAFATESNPEYIVAQKELAGLRAQLARLEKSTRSGPGDIFVATGDVPEVGLEYVRKLRDVKYFETMFEILAKQYEIAKADEARDSSTIQVLDKAMVPERKSAPVRSRIVLFTALIVGFLALVLAFLNEAMDSARRNPELSGRLNVLRRYVWSGSFRFRR